MTWEINETIGSLSVDNFDKTISGLDANTDYEYKAFFVVAGDYYYGQTLTATTMALPTNIPIINTLGHTNATGESFDVEIEITDKGNLPIIRYGVLYKLGSGVDIEFIDDIPTTGVNLVDVWGDVTLIPHTDEILISSLSENTTVFYRAFAQNLDGFGYGVVKSFKTTAVPELMDSIGFTVITNGDSYVTGNVYLNIGATRHRTITLSKTKQNGSFSNLNPNTVYNIDFGVLALFDVNDNPLTGAFSWKHSTSTNYTNGSNIYGLEVTDYLHLRVWDQE